MSVPVFKLQIVYVDGTAIPFHAGSSFERDLVQVCKRAILAKGVGLWKTEAHVAKDIEDGIAEAIRELKREAKAAL